MTCLRLVRRQGSRCRSGFTLLEVLLALGLTVMVLALVGTAVHSVLRTVDSGRRRAEREQLARAIMHRIANDLRAVVRYEPFDDSGLSTDIGGGMGGAARAMSGMNSGGSGQTTGDPAAQAGGTGASQSSTQSTGEEQTEETAEDTVTMPVAGIYGDASQVSIDITRIPRLDEYLYADGINAPLFRGDVRTVSYYLSGAQSTIIPGIAPAVGTSDATTSTTSGNSGGLTRQEADRATSLGQMQSAGTGTNQNAVILAPEVATLEFRYFDGTQWQTQWDSTVMKGVPRAVEIAIYLNDDPNDPRLQATSNFATAGITPTTNNPDNFYRIVVHLPAGLPLPAVQATTEEETEEGSTSGTSTTGGGTTTSGGQQ